MNDRPAKSGTARKKRRLLLLAGTFEARQVARWLAERAGDQFEATASLAGVTDDPKPYPITTRTGGFGGSDGLRDYLIAHRIDAVVDATHPFAAQMSAHATCACSAANVALIRLERPPWYPRDGDAWTSIPCLASSKRLIADGEHVLLATGSGSVGDGVALAERLPGAQLTLRAVVRPAANLPDNLRLLIARPPFSENNERALFQELGITRLVTKNAGGRAGETKLEAARALGLPVAMIARPPRPSGPAHICETVTDVGAALNAFASG